MAARLDDRAAGAIERAAVAARSQSLLDLARDYRAGRLDSRSAFAAIQSHEPPKSRIARELLEKAITLLDALDLRAITTTKLRGATRDTKGKRQ